MSTLYLSVTEILELHRILIDQFGGSHGVRDHGLVESAAYRPQSGYYETLSVQAAALFHSFALNHAFVDGNKRVAFAAAAVFLSMNGYRLALTADDGEDFIVQKLIQDKVELEAIAQWLEARMRAKK
jgi:death-on-curing protein